MSSATLYIYLPVVAEALFAIPLAHAFRRGIEAARDPSHRMTRMAAWEHFGRVAWRKLRWWWWVWASLILASSPIYYLRHIQPGRMLGVRGFIVYSTYFPVGLLGLWMMTLACCIFWEPRCKGKKSGRVLTIGTSLGAYLLLYWIQVTALPFKWEVYAYSASNGIGLYPYYNFSFALVVTAAVWIFIRRNDAWFRFEE